MRCIVLAAAAAVASIGSFATAADFGRWSIEPALDFAPLVAAETVVGSSYNVATAIGAASPILLDVSPAVRDDKVVFDFIEEEINPYLAVAGGIQRFVTESSTDLGGGLTEHSFTIRGVAPTGGPGDLWTKGLASGGTPLTNGYVYFGPTLSAALGGAGAISVPAGNVVLANSMTIVVDGVEETFSLPDNFFATVLVAGQPTWDGFLGVRFNGAAADDPLTSGPDVVSSITLRVVVPEPATLGLLAGVSVLGLRRRA